MSIKTEDIIEVKEGVAQLYFKRAIETEQKTN